MLVAIYFSNGRESVGCGKFVSNRLIVDKLATVIALIVRRND